MTAPEEDALGFTWDALGKSLGVIAVLLPAIGAGVRWVSYRFAPSVPEVVAVRTSIGELAGTGFLAIVVAIPIAAALVLYFRAMAPTLFTAQQLKNELRSLEQRVALHTPDQGTSGSESEIRRQRLGALGELERQLEQLGPDEVVPPALAAEWKALEVDLRSSERSDASKSDHRPSGARLDELRSELSRIQPQWRRLREAGRTRIAAMGTAIVLATGVVLGMPGFPFISLNVVGVGASLLILRWAATKHGRVPLSMIVTVVFITGSVAAVSAGLTGSTGGPVGTVDFRGDGLRDGRYVSLGYESGTHVLKSCSTDEVLQVRDDQIVIVVFDREQYRPPNLWGQLTTGTPTYAGATAPCRPHWR